MFKKKIWKVAKWSFVVIAIYYFITLLYFGYSQVDEKKGFYTFYWSGLQALFNDQEFGIKENKTLDTAFDGVDGPYVMNEEVYSVNEKGQLIKSLIPENKKIKVVTGHNYLSNFSLTLKHIDQPDKDIYATPDRLIAISDIEGNFTGFYSFLLNNQVIDKSGNWIFGEGHLVLNGDFVDRGTAVTQLLWFIYRLEQQAKAQGGKVHYILGNHEIMMLQGNVAYADFKYIHAAKEITGINYWDLAMRSLYSEGSELGKWLRTKNVVERIGNNLFVHAGLTVRHQDANLDIQTLNKIARENYGKPYDNKFKSKMEEMTLSTIYSPYWERSLAMDAKNKALYFFNNIKINEMSQKELTSVLKFYGSTSMIIGHSIVDDIKVDYSGKVIKIDIKHGTTLKSGETKGILIENDRLYKVDDASKKIALKQ